MGCRLVYDSVLSSGHLVYWQRVELWGVLGQAIFAVLFVVLYECLYYFVRNGTGGAGCGGIIMHVFCHL